MLQRGYAIWTLQRPVAAAGAAIKVPTQEVSELARLRLWEPVGI